MLGLRNALLNAPMSQQDRDKLSQQMMGAAGQTGLTSSQREGELFKVFGNTVANKIQDRGLRRSLLDAMGQYDTAEMRGMTRSQRGQMMGAVDMRLPQPVTPAQITSPSNTSMFGAPSQYKWNQLSSEPRNQMPWGTTYGEDDYYGY